MRLTTKHKNVLKRYVRLGGCISQVSRESHCSRNTVYRLIKSDEGLEYMASLDREAIERESKEETILNDIDIELKKRMEEGKLSGRDLTTWRQSLGNRVKKQTDANLAFAIKDLGFELVKMQVFTWDDHDLCIKMRDLGYTFYDKILSDIENNVKQGKKTIRDSIESIVKKESDPLIIKDDIERLYHDGLTAKESLERKLRRIKNCQTGKEYIKRKESMLDDK